MVGSTFSLNNYKKKKIKIKVRWMYVFKTICRMNKCINSIQKCKTLSWNHNGNHHALDHEMKTCLRFFFIARVSRWRLYLLRRYHTESALDISYIYMSTKNSFSLLKRYKRDGKYIVIPPSKIMEKKKGAGFFTFFFSELVFRIV